MFIPLYRLKMQSASVTNTANTPGKNLVQITALYCKSKVPIKLSIK